MVLRFGKKQSAGDYQLQNCTFKPQTNAAFNDALTKTSAIMQTRRPTSAHPLQSSNAQGSVDNRKKLAKQNIAAATSIGLGAATNPAASLHTTSGVGAFGSSLMSRILDQSKKRYNNDDLASHSKSSMTAAAHAGSAQGTGSHYGEARSKYLSLS